MSSERLEALLKDLRDSTTVDWYYVEYHDWWGEAGSSLSYTLNFHCSQDELLARHPGATNKTMMRATMVMMKQRMKEKRDEICREKYERWKQDKPCSIWRCFCHFFRSLLFGG